MKFQFVSALKSCSTWGMRGVWSRPISALTLLQDSNPKRVEAFSQVQGGLVCIKDRRGLFQ